MYDHTNTQLYSCKTLDRTRKTLWNKSVGIRDTQKRVKEGEGERERERGKRKRVKERERERERERGRGRQKVADKYRGQFYERNRSEGSSGWRNIINMFMSKCPCIEGGAFKTLNMTQTISL